jgi:uncharacterized BrkB/YihY/UPF0761 family membrane protein
MADSLAVMLAGFPAGLLIPATISDFLHKFGTQLPEGWVGFLLIWLIAAASGYFQWFVLLPLLYFRLKKLILRSPENGRGA